MKWFEKKNDLKAKVYKAKLKDAQNVIEDKSRLNKLIDTFSSKLSKAKLTTKLKAILDDTHTAVALLKAWITGDYRDISTQSIIYLVGGILYFIMPIDAIPDILISVGLLDDISVLGFIFASLTDELTKFKIYQENQATYAPSSQQTQDSGHD
jgi:uncharacterized membrane protein YkvA (DUF1232 family)